MANGIGNVWMSSHSKIHEAANEGLVGSLSCPGDMLSCGRGFVRASQLEATNHGGADRVCIALAKFFNNLVDEGYL